MISYPYVLANIYMLFCSLLTKTQKYFILVDIMIDSVYTEILPSLKPELDISYMYIRITVRSMEACLAATVPRCIDTELDFLGLCNY